MDTDTTQAPLAVEAGAGIARGGQIGQEGARIFDRWTAPRVGIKVITPSSTSWRFGLFADYHSVTFTGACCGSPHYHRATVGGLVGLVAHASRHFETGPRLGLGLYATTRVTKEGSEPGDANAGALMTVGWNVLWRVGETWGLVGDVGGSIASQRSSDSFNTFGVEYFFSLGVRVE